MLATADERVVVEARRHGIVLVKPLLRSSALAALGAACVVAGWPFSAVGAALLGVAAIAATLAVWRWDRTRVVLTTEKLFVVHGIVRRHAAAVRLDRVPALELEQTLPARVLGYGTLLAGDLEIRYVPQATRVAGLATRLVH